MPVEQHPPVSFRQESAPDRPQAPAADQRAEGDARIVPMPEPDGTLDEQLEEIRAQLAWVRDYL
jgi:hypothetical protein